MNFDLPSIWAVIILFSIMMYIIMDGFDLCIGILYPFFKPWLKPRRKRAANEFAGPQRSLEDSWVPMKPRLDKYLGQD